MARMKFPAWVTLGRRVTVHRYVTLGSTPFAYKPLEAGKTREHRPVTAGVRIGDDVEIMDHANIDRGLDRDTTIGDGTVIDRGVHVAHDSIIGRNCILVAGTVVGGFCELGDDVYLGINVSVKPRVKIGAGAKIGMGAVVLHDVPAGEVWVGNPARFLKRKV